MTQLRLNTLVAAVFSALVAAYPAAAQTGPSGWGPGMMMGPSMMGAGMMGGGMCNPRAAGLAEWRVEVIERTVRPTEAQRTTLNELKAASAKAAETIKAACPRELPETPTARLELMEKRLERHAPGGQSDPASVRRILCHPHQRPEGGAQ